MRRAYLALLLAALGQAAPPAPSVVLTQPSTGRRFRVQPLSCSLLRLEAAAADGMFEDRTTFLVPNRRWPGAPRLLRSNGTHAATSCYSVGLTDRLLHVYNGSGGQVWQASSLRAVKPRQAMPAPGDQFDMWAVLDQPRFAVPSQGPLPGSARQFDRSRPSDDAYFWIKPAGTRLGYTKLRSDLLALTGPVPLLPDYALGLWFTWYHNYTAEAKLSEIREFGRRGFELSVAGLDMDWRLHPCYPNSPTPNCSDTPLETERHYVTNTGLFPDMRHFLQQAHLLNVSVFFNDHPMPPSPVTDFPELSPAEIEFRYEGLRSQLNVGLDFWWFDCHWHDLIPGLNDTDGQLDYVAWGQYVFTSVLDDFNAGASQPPGRKKQRTVMLGCSSSSHRANHRTPVFWTGDNHYDQLALGVAQMVDAGVDLKPWVHQDCGGHHGPGSVLEPLAYPGEVYARWLQFCSLGTIARLHSDPGMSRLPWLFGPGAERIARSFVQLRAQLMPTLVAAARRTSQDGTPIVQRCDLSWPDLASEGAGLSSQYLLAGELLVHPVDPFAGIPVNDSSKHTYSPPSGKFNRNATVWLPPGEWHHAFTGQRLEGPRNLSLTDVPVDQLPLFHRGGGMLVTSTGRGQATWDRPTLEIWPTRAAFTNQPSARTVVVQHLYPPSDSDVAGTRRPWVVTKRELAATVQLDFAPGDFQANRWTLRVHLPSDAAGPIELNCGGVRVPTSIEYPKRDAPAAFQPLMDDVPPLAPAGVLTGLVDFGARENGKALISCQLRAQT